MFRRIIVLALVFVVAVVATLTALAWLERGRSSARPGSSDERSIEGGVPFAVDGSSSEIRIGEDDLNKLVRRGLEGHPNGRRALELSKEVRAGIDKGRVEVGAVVNFSEIPREELTEKERAAIDRITALLPFLDDRDLYLAVSGVPTVRDGKVTVNEDLKVKLAFVTLPLAEFGSLLGMSPEPIQDKLAIDLSPFRAYRVDVLDDQLVIFVGSE